MTAPILAVPTAQDLGRPLAISTDLRAGRVTVAGELERATAHHLLDVLEALTLSGHHTWTVDAAGITFCDVEGIRVLARAQSLARSRGRALVLVGPRPFLVYSLVLVGMQSLVDPPPAGSVHGRVGPARRRETTQR
ncbi:STAS domain-containing protein [Geodermatophilus sp. SYSU D00700]